MRPTPKRTPVNKGKSAKIFAGHSSKSHRVNMAPPPMRGGYRM